MSEPRDKIPLDYERPPHGRIPIGAQATIGAVVTTVVLSAAGFGIGWTAMMVAANNLLPLLVIVLGGGATIFVTVAVARRQQLDPSRRGWAIGTYIGLGLAVLINGLCFVSLTGIGR